MRSMPPAALATAPAKLNFSLRITGRRVDGYHFISSLVAPIATFDYLTLSVAPSAASAVHIDCQPAVGLPVAAANLAFRAAELFLRRSGLRGAVSIALIKHIPIGAGLGGGSSDAAAVLQVLNRLTGTNVPPTELTDWALELGADVPFFLYGRPALMTGVGERLQPWRGPNAQPIVVAYASVPSSTAAVYAKYDDLLTTRTGASSIPPLKPGQEPLRSLMQNDLEVAAFQLQPSLRRLKERLVALGADEVCMTGSGSAMFGTWTRWNDAQHAAEQLRTAGIWARVTRIIEQTPAIELFPGTEVVGGRSPSW
jgi:4-diphosphocytidyl-2-C-methyl-D-erythritol kinase